MGISLEQYRFKIGLNEPYSRSKSSKTRVSSQNRAFFYKSVFIIVFLLTTPIFPPRNTLCRLQSSCYLPSYDDFIPDVCEDTLKCCSIAKVAIIIENVYSLPIHWSYRVKVSALCHAILGNRRRHSYKFGFWNCRKGLLINNEIESAKFSEIKSFLSNHRPHVFGIVECDIHSRLSRLSRQATFDTEQVLTNLKIEGYTLELPDTWYQYGQARLIVYVSNEISYKIYNPHFSNDLPNISLEVGLGKERKTLLNYFYREWTSGVTGENSLISQVDRLKNQISYWRHLYATNRDIVCLGDANVCALTWNNSDFDASRKVLSNLIQEHLLDESSYQIVEDFTRSEWSRNGLSRSCIDHIYTNVPAKCNKPKVIAAGDSDHLAVVVSKLSREISNRAPAVLRRSYKNFDTVSFLTDIYNCMIDDAVLACNNLNDAALNFKEIFCHILDRHAPCKIIQLRSNYVPYLSADTKQLMKYRDSIKEEATKQADPELLKEFKRLRNEVRQRIIKDRGSYYQNQFQDQSFSVRQSWKLVYSLIGGKGAKGPSKISFNNSILSQPKEIAMALNRIFVDKVTKLREKTATEAKIDPILRLRSWLSKERDMVPEFRLKEISLSKLRSIIKKKMKPSKSHGCDFIDSFSLKLAFPLIEESILHLVNLSIRESSYAHEWKTQLVLPLHKKDDPLVGSNYRPVSHIVEIGKIVEYVVHEQVYDHFVSQQLFHANHHGFLRNHSTATALIQLYDLWLTAADKKELSAALLLDLSAAFDIVDHKIFLDKLRCYNFSEDTVSWFKSYLESRSQIVQVQTKFSDNVNLGEYGVPQGSILGPLIFLIYNNDFPASSIEGESVLYADDNTDVVSSNDILDLKSKLQREAHRSTEWVQDNRMVCSGPKTKLLILGTNQLRNNLLAQETVSVEVCGSIVQETSSERLLGLVVNNRLTWSDYVVGNDSTSGLVTQLNKRVGLLSKLCHLMPKDKFVLLCNGLFYSKLLYCLQVFANCWCDPNLDESVRRFPAFTRNDNAKLQVLQNKVMRLKCGLPFDTPTTKLIEVTGDLSVQQLTAYMTLTTAHRAIVKKQPRYFASKLKLRTRENIPVLPDRHQFTFDISSRLTIVRGGFFYRSASLFNKLPLVLRSCMNPKEFKSKVKDWIRSNVPVKPE